MKLTASLSVSSCFALLALASGLVTAARGQINESGYESGYTATLTRDLMFGPEWRAYQSMAQPGQNFAQQPNPIRQARLAPLPAPAVAPAPLTKQADNALRFFGGESARHTLQQMPQRPAMVSSAPVRMAPRGKPFQRASRGPTISPYLNLFRQENSEELPNYLTFVRPQQEQFDTNHRQQRELLQLERKVQMAAYGAGVNTRAAPPSTGHGTRFGDTGRYYGNWRR